MLSPFVHQVPSISSPFLNRRRGSVVVGSTSPLALFSGGAIGVWFDPSDVANLAWRRNLYTYTEDFSNAVWTKSGSPTLTNQGGGVWRLQAAAGLWSVLQGLADQTGTIYTSSIEVKSNGASLDGFQLMMQGAFVGGNRTATSEWVRYSATGTNGGSGSVGICRTTTGTAVDILIRFPQLEVGTVTTDYQRITEVNTEVIERFPTATMFQDATGTTLVTTPGQPVGLRLDKSKGLVLGSELVTNGTFNTNTTGWTPSATAALSVQSGQLRIDASGTFPTVSQAFTTVIGKSYKFTASFDQATANRACYINPISGVNIVASSTSGTLSCVFNATATTTTIVVGLFATLAATGYALFDNISVKELPGNHATQSTLAARPTYGIEPRGGRRNLLTWTEDLGNAAWPFGGSIRTTNFGIAPDGTRTSCRLQFSAENQDIRQNVTVGGIGTASVWMKGTAGQTVFLVNNLTDAGINVTLDGSWQRVVRTGPTTSAINIVIGTWNSATARDFEIWHPQLELGSTVTPYQKVTTEFDVTEAGVPTCHYVAYGGSHHMVTNSIDFTVTDKMSVFAGVRKLSDVAVGFLLESGTNFNPRGITIYNNVDGRYSLGGHNGSGFMGYYAAAISAPASSILSMGYDISGVGSRDSEALFTRVNGATSRSAIEGPWAEGTGNFAANPLYIGRRAGTTFPFNGRDYGIIVVGKTTSPTEISTTESWLGEKTGFFAPVITGVPTIGVS